MTAGDAPTGHDEVFLDVQALVDFFEQRPQRAVVLDRRAARDPGSFGATVCVVDVDLATGELAYVTAGHPPPLVLDRSAGEAGRYLAPSGAGPLGSGGEIAARCDRLDDGEIVVLHTDGLVELPGRTSAEGTVAQHVLGLTAIPHTS